MANKAGGASKTAQAQNYKTSERWKTNRKRKLSKLAKLHPNNLQLVAAMQNMTYRRRNPTAQQWSKSQIRLAKIFKRFSGAASKEMFSTNEKVSIPALMQRSNYTALKMPTASIFSLGERIKGKVQWN